MSHFRDRCALAVIAFELVACRDPSSSPARGPSLALLAPVGAIAAVDSYRVVLKGASSSVTRGGRSGQTVSFTGLKEGSYTLAVLGLSAGEVASFSSNIVQIGALSADTVRPVLTSFQPTLTPLPALSIQARTTVRWTSVVGAEGYVLERGTDSLFKNVQTTSVSTNQADVTLAPGLYFFRARAVNQFVPAPDGRPSGTSFIEVAVPSLTFSTEPSLTPLGQTLTSVRVTILAGRRIVTSANDAITVTLAANPSSGVLSGTTIVNAVNGVATFNTLSVDRWGAGYTLRAALGEVTSAVSAPFDVRRAFLRANGGDGFTCSVLTTAAAYCWGSNATNQLGDNTVVDQPNPVAVASTLQFTRISSGGGHACALTVAQQPVCWGMNDSGQVGDGSIVKRAAPVAVSGSLVADVISAGFRHSCAVRVGPPRRISCWGWNNSGQLGTGTFTRSSTPVQVNSALDWQDVSAGADYTCATRVGGGVFCWGKNNVGQLGIGDSTLRTTPTAVANGGGFTRVTTGDAHSCAMSGTNVFCWGLNASGQLGSATFTSRVLPIQVVNAPASTLVTAGGQHTCALATTGDAYCWGSNSQGQLGDGTNVDRTTPMLVVGGRRFVDLSAGFQHTCGLTATGGLYCWGYGKFGELGNGILNTANTPRPVTGSMP